MPFEPRSAPNLLYPFVQAADIVPPTHDPARETTMPDASRDGGATQVAAPQFTFGGGVSTVLESARATPPPATLEEARNQPGRAEQIEQITRRIEAEGIKYVFFQQVSVTGRVMGKGVVAVVLPPGGPEGLPARLRRDRQPLHRPSRRVHRLRPRGVRARRDGRSRRRSPSCPGIRASRACSATATTPRPASCSTPTRGRTSSASPPSSRRSWGCTSSSASSPR